MNVQEAFELYRYPVLIGYFVVALYVYISLIINEIRQLHRFGIKTARNIRQAMLLVGIKVVVIFIVVAVITFYFMR